MNSEWFSKLREYDSLSKMRVKVLSSIDEEENRIKNLSSKKQEALDKVTILKKEFSTLQQTYFEFEKRMKNYEEQASRLKDIGGDEAKILSYQTEASKIENELFNLLEKTDQVQLELEEKKVFLQGIEKTISEIEQESKVEVEKLKQELSQLDLRLQLILDELPPDFRGVLERTLKKKLALGPFTRVENGSCYFCRYKISRIDESEIDLQKQLKTCPQCSRIFLPYGH